MQPRHPVPSPSRLAASALGLLVVSFSVAQAPPPAELPLKLMVVDLGWLSSEGQPLSVQNPFVLGINNRGVVVGWSSLSITGVRNPAVWEPKVIETNIGGTNLQGRYRSTSFRPAGSNLQANYIAAAVDDAGVIAIGPEGFNTMDAGYLARKSESGSFTFDQIGTLSGFRPFAMVPAVDPSFSTVLGVGMNESPSVPATPYRVPYMAPVPTPLAIPEGFVGAPYPKGANSIGLIVGSGIRSEFDPNTQTLQPIQRGCWWHNGSTGVLPHTQAFRAVFVAGMSRADLPIVFGHMYQPPSSVLYAFASLGKEGVPVNLGGGGAVAANHRGCIVSVDGSEETTGLRLSLLNASGTAVERTHLYQKGDLVYKGSPADIDDLRGAVAMNDTGTIVGNVRVTRGGQEVQTSWMALPLYAEKVLRLPVKLGRYVGAGTKPIAYWVLQNGVPVQGGTVNVLGENRPGSSAEDFYVDLAVSVRGPVRIHFQGSHWLGQYLDGLEIPYGIGDCETDLGLTLTNGDVDRDNQVTVFDYDRLSAAFDRTSSDPSWLVADQDGITMSDADLDGDGAVTVFDYDILSSEFDRQGADL